MKVLLLSFFHLQCRDIIEDCSIASTCLLLVPGALQQCLNLWMGCAFIRSEASEDLSTTSIFSIWPSLSDGQDGCPICMCSAYLLYSYLLVYLFLTYLIKSKLHGQFSNLSRCIIPIPKLIKSEIQVLELVRVCRPIPKLRTKNPDPCND